MSNTTDLYEQIKALYEAFDENHNQNAETGTKASGTVQEKQSVRSRNSQPNIAKHQLLNQKKIDPII